MKKNISLIFLTTFSLVLFAQTGPGGVGNSSSNVIWLDASQIGVANGAPVANWPDKSGNNNDFTQAVGAQQPTFRAFEVNAEPSVDFFQDFLESSAIPALNVNDFSQFIVAKSDNNNHTGFLLHNAYSAGANSFSDKLWGTHLSKSNNQFNSFIRNSSGLGLNVAVGYQVGYNILSSIMSSSTNTITAQFNNSSSGSASGYNAIPSGHIRTRLGSEASSFTNLFFGNIAEVIIYNTALNTAQENIVNNFLAAKFRRTIANDIYAHIFYRFEVFGVGQEADGNNTTAQGTGIVEFSSPVLNNGDYILAGHDNASLLVATNDVPGSLAGASRLQRIWRADATGTPGTLTISFDVSGTVYASETTFNLVVEDDDGIFNNGGTTDFGPATKVGNIVTFTNVTLPDNSHFSLFGPSTGIQSITSGNWSSTSTWNCSCVPGLNDNVTIVSPHTVTVDVHSSTDTITVDAGATLAFNSSRRLFVFGDMDVSGAISSNLSTIWFQGTVKQNFRNLSGNTISMYNFYVQNASNLELHTGSFEVSNSVFIDAGQIQNSTASFTFLSTAAKTAIILNTTGSNGFSGEFIMQRHFTTRNASWGDLSSPVSNATLGGWDSDPSGTTTELFMSHVGGIDGNAAGFFSVWEYDEVLQKFDSIIDTNYVLTKGRGLELWLGDDFTTLNAKTIDTRGTPNFGAINVSVRNGFNLIGNPYNSWVKWTKLTKATLKSTFFIWETDNGSFTAFTNANIAPHQGFWVESVGNGTMRFDENDKATTTSSLFLKTDMDDFEAPAPDDKNMMTDVTEQYEFLEAKLKIKSNSYYYSHELKLRMNNLASAQYDEFDGSFMVSRLEEAPSITAYSVNSNKKLAINSFNYQEEVIIPIAVSVGISGEHIIEPINFETLENDFEFIELKDNKTGKIYNLKNKFKGNGITFNMTKGDDDRFTLRLSNLLSRTSEIAENNISVYKTIESTVIEFDDSAENYEISIYNSIGQKVVESFSSNGQNKILIDNNKFPKGMNIIRIKSANSTFTKKIVY